MIGIVLNRSGNFLGPMTGNFAAGERTQVWPILPDILQRQRGSVDETGTPRGV